MNNQDLEREVYGTVSVVLYANTVPYEPDWVRLADWGRANKN